MDTCKFHGLFMQDNITVDNYDQTITTVSGAVRGAATSEQEQTTGNLATVADVFARSAALVNNNTIIREEVSLLLLCLGVWYQQQGRRQKFEKGFRSAGKGSEWTEVCSADQFVQSAEKIFTVVFQLPGWALVAPSPLCTALPLLLVSL